MPDEWVETPLGDVLTQVQRPVDVATVDDVPYAGVRWYAQGVYARPVSDASEVKAKKLNRVDLDDITYNRMWATKGAFGVVGTEAVGCLVTNDFPLFVAGEALLPAFLGLVFQTPGFQESAASLAVGTTERKRLKEVDFLRLTIRIPPLAVQRRIVDLMAHLDNHLENLRAEQAAVAMFLASVLDDWDRQLQNAPVVPLANLCSPRSGPSWSAGEESRESSSEAVRVVKITNTRPDGTLDMTDETYVVGVPETAVRLSDRCLILVRTNGNRDRIGNVYRPTPEAYGCVVSAFQFAAVLGTVEERDWLYWWLKAPARQAAMSEAASGTTGLGNLAAGWLKALEVPWPDDATRLRLVSSVETLATNRESLAREVASLERLRLALLRGLLSGEADVAVGYDALFGEVA